MDQLFQDNFVHSTAKACVDDLTPPTFAGIVSVAPHLNGSFLLSWAAATEVDSNPVEYVLYAAKGSLTAASLFLPANVSGITKELSKRLFQHGEPSPYYFSIDDVYTFGVRAKDALGNTETNTAILTATATGSAASIDEFQDALDRLEAIAPKFGQRLKIQTIQEKLKVRLIQNPKLKVKIICD